MSINKRTFAGILVLAAGAFLLAQGMLMHVFSPGTRGDLDILLNAGARFASGSSVYVLSDANEHTKPPLLSPLLAVLSSLPREPVRICWDLMNCSLPFVLLLFFFHDKSRTSVTSRRAFWVAAAGAVVLLRGAWRAEMDFGQYNLLSLFLLMMGLRNLRGGHPVRAGGLFLISLLLKPTQLFFLPWVGLAAGPVRRSTILRASGGALACAAGLSLLYACYRPLAELLPSQLEWIEFLRASTQKHLLRTDNWGLPSVFARLGMPGLESTGVLLSSIALLAVAARRWTGPHEQLFHLSAVVSLAMSPMTWNQNFIILLPLAFRLVFRILFKKRTGWAWTGALSLFLPNALKPSNFGVDFTPLWTSMSIPLLSAILALLAEWRRPSHE
jgi:hypothetical protein